MDRITTGGIDLAKSTFSLHGVDEHGKVTLRRTVGRARLLDVLAQLPACRVGMEACSGAHEWAQAERLAQASEAAERLAAKNASIVWAIRLRECCGNCSRVAVLTELHDPATSQGEGVNPVILIRTPRAS